MTAALGPVAQLGPTPESPAPSPAISLRGGIARRLVISFSLLLGIFGVAASLALASLHELHEALHAVEHDAARMRVALNLASAVRDQYAHMAHTIIIGDDSHRTLYDEAAARVRTTAAAVRDGASDEQSRELVSRIRQSSAALDTSFQTELIPAIQAGKLAVAAELHPWILETVSAAQTAADELASAGQNSIAQFGAHARLVQHAAVRWLLGFLVTALLCAGGVALYLHRSIARPVAALLGGAARIGAGDLEVRLEIDSADELGRLAEQFNVMAAALKENQSRLVQQERVAAVGRLAAGVAHEINNPLGVILGYVKLLRRNRTDDSKELAIVEEEAERCREIVQDLLDLTRQGVPRREFVDLRALCEEAMERLRVSSDRTDVQFAIRGSGSTVGSRKQIAQVVQNLLKNALEAAGSGGRVSVEIVSPRPGTLTLSVSDDGPGIDASHEQFIFEPFFTTKASGTGLGLALSRAIARAHGGDLELLSEGTQTATFRLSLPTEQGASS